MLHFTETLFPSTAYPLIVSPSVQLRSNSWSNALHSMFILSVGMNFNFDSFFFLYLSLFYSLSLLFYVFIRTLMTFNQKTNINYYFNCTHCCRFIFCCFDVIIGWQTIKWSNGKNWKKKKNSIFIKWEHLLINFHLNK